MVGPVVCEVSCTSPHCKDCLPDGSCVEGKDGHFINPDTNEIEGKNQF